MASCAKPYYCYDIDDYPTEIGCDTQDEYLSGWDAVALVQCGTTITDPSDETEINNLVSQGKLKLIKNIKGGLDEPSALTIDSTTSCGTSKTINYDRTFTFQDFKVSKEVLEWYNEAVDLSFGGALLRGCDGTVTYVDAEVKITAALSGENNNAVAKFVTGTLSWRSKYNPLPYEEPTGLFA
jgi:hypothetical protein